MNSRIDPLIEQCTIQQFSDCVGGYETFDREQFAELIVRECALFVFKQNGPKSALNLLEHFGVEE